MKNAYEKATDRFKSICERYGIEYKILDPREVDLRIRRIDNGLGTKIVAPQAIGIKVSYLMGIFLNGDIDRWTFIENNGMYIPSFELKTYFESMFFEHYKRSDKGLLKDIDNLLNGLEYYLSREL